MFHALSRLFVVIQISASNTFILRSPAFYDLMNEIKKEYREKLALGEVDLETDLYGCDAKIVTRDGNVTTIAEAAADIVPTFMTKTIVTTSPIDNHVADEEYGVKRSRRRRMRGSGGYRKRTSKHSNKNGTQTTKPPPLRKGAKMIDKRTVTGKRLLTESVTFTSRELAARAAMARFSATGSTSAEMLEHTATTTEANHLDGSYDVFGGCSDDSSNENDDDYIIQPHQGNCACRSCDWDRLLFMPTTKSSN
jgi:hypothetical protein